MFKYCFIWALDVVITACIQSEIILAPSPRSRFKQKSGTWIQIQMLDIETILLMIFYELTLLDMCLWYVCEELLYCISFNRLYCQERTIMLKTAYEVMQAHGLSSNHPGETSMDTYGCFCTSSTTVFGDISTKIFWSSRNGHNPVPHLPTVWWAKASLCFAFSCELSERQSPWRAAGSRAGSLGHGALCTPGHETTEDFVPTCLRPRKKQ